MFGAGKRKIKLPARYAASPAEDDPEWLSTPTDNLAEQLDNEILDVSRRIEQMKVDMGLENRTESTSTPLPTHGDVIGQRSTIPEALAQDPQDGRHQRLSTRAPKPIAPPDGHYPTLREVRAFHKAHNDPSIFTQYFPRQTGGTHVADTIRSSDGRPMQFNLQHVSDEDAHPPTQGKKLSSGLSRKAHDRVVREVNWPHEFVFSANTTITHDSLTLDQLVAGEMAIILSPHTNPMESQNRGHILKGLMLDVPTYSFPGIKNFYKILFIHVEHGLVTIDSTTTLSEVHKLKEEHLRRSPRNHNSIDGQAGHGHATPVERAGGSGSTYCYRFQANNCAFSADHIAASGTLHVHACKFCARHRPGVDAGHPAKFCPYNRDRGRQGNHAAARDTLA
ncbi:hypothetical protein Bbelb_151250 [Branchiostoma belcheri]|nr:hypothetical protein Bbelb_151250 [Branchiostoma belcheri]